MASPRTLHDKLDAAAQRELHTNEQINTFACCATYSLQRRHLHLVPPADAPVFRLQLQLRIPIGIRVTNDGLPLSHTLPLTRCSRYFDLDSVLIFLPDRLHICLMDVQAS